MSHFLSIPAARSVSCTAKLFCMQESCYKKTAEPPVVRRCGSFLKFKSYGADYCLFNSRGSVRPSSRVKVSPFTLKMT